MLSGPGASMRASVSGPSNRPKLCCRAAEALFRLHLPRLQIGPIQREAPGSTGQRAPYRRPEAAWKEATGTRNGPWIRRLETQFEQSPALAEACLPPATKPGCRDCRTSRSRTSRGLQRSALIAQTSHRCERLPCLERSQVRIHRKEHTTFADSFFAKTSRSAACAIPPFRQGKCRIDGARNLLGLAPR